MVLAFLFSFACCKAVFLGTMNSTDTAGCGESPSFPCATLRFASGLCEDGDSIIIEEGIYNDQPNVEIVSLENLQILSQGMH